MYVLYIFHPWLFGAFLYGTHKDLMMSCLEPSAPDPTLRSCAWSLWEDRAENNQLWRGQKLPSRTSRTTKKSKNNSVIVEVYINQLFGLTDSKGAHGVRESNILLKGLCCQSSCYQRHDGADYLQVRWLEVHHDSWTNRHWFFKTSIRLQWKESLLGSWSTKIILDDSSWIWCGLFTASSQGDQLNDLRAVEGKLRLEDCFSVMGHAILGHVRGLHEFDMFWWLAITWTHKGHVQCIKDTNASMHTWIDLLFNIICIYIVQLSLMMCLSKKHQNTSKYNS